MTPIPEEFGRPMIEAAKAYSKAFVNQGEPTRYAKDDFQSGAEWAYRLLSDQGLRWVEVEDATPPMIEGKDYSENVFVVCNGKLEVMAYCWINGGDEENSGYAWCNCYGNINADADLEFDDDYKPSHWAKLPTAPIQ